MINSKKIACEVPPDAYLSLPRKQKASMNRRIICTIFCIAACSLRTAIALQSGQFFAFRRSSTVLDSSDRGGVCCRVFREKSNIEDDSLEENSIAPSHVSLDDEKIDYFSGKRRDLISLSTISGFVALTGTFQSNRAKAIDIFEKKGLYVLNTRNALSATRNEQVEVFPKLSSEYALLRVLPVKNTVFRTVEQNLEALSVLRYRIETSQENIDKAWAKANSSVDTALTILINKRNQLKPVFNPDDSSAVAKVKGERGERLLGDLSQDLKYLKEAIDQRNITCAFKRQRSGLLNLGFLGELLVKEYPYKVPYKGKYSFLPRLLGRAQVTFRFKRGGTILGNVKIIADGYVAPITAGNFVDLCIRNFYTGLPVKGPTKKLGLLYQESQYNLPINIIGSYNEGFFDPLTGQLRQIPLEIILIEGTQKLSYSYSRRFAEPNFEVGEAKFVPETTSKQLLTFETPGLVAFNHPIGNPNGGSSEFFALQSSATKDGTLKRSMLDGQYAPFGYIIEGFDIFDSLQPGDIIDSTIVDGFGQQNLVKIRSSTFKEVAQGTEEASAKAKNRPLTSKELKEGTEETTVKTDNLSSTSKEPKKEQRKQLRRPRTDLRLRRN